MPGILAVILRTVFVLLPTIFLVTSLNDAPFPQDQLLQHIPTIIAMALAFVGSFVALMLVVVCHSCGRKKSN